MENPISISSLNDFVFCPRSIYFHNLYYFLDEGTYKDVPQAKGRASHETIESGKYSSKAGILKAISVYSEELGIAGKIDLLDLEKKTLIERKRKISQLYEGYLLQVYAQYFCLIEMGFSVEKIKIHSVSDNKTYDIPIPGEAEKARLKEILLKMNSYDLAFPFSQNPKKCAGCIYRNACDIYENDE